MFGNKKFDYDPEDSRQTLDDLRRGSAEAFQILYNKYNKKVYRFCLRMLGSQDIAKDAYQEIFIKIFEHRKEFRGNNFAAWLFTIARHTCLNLMRTEKEFDSLEEVLEFTTNEKESDAGLKDYIQKAISTLPILLREAIILREYEDLSYQEIAQVLNIDLSLAKIRVFRAREILRKLLIPIKQELYES